MSVGWKSKLSHQIFPLPFDLGQDIVLKTCETHGNDPESDEMKLIS